MKTIMFTVKSDRLMSTIEQIRDNYDVETVDTGFNEVVYLSLKFLNTGWRVLLTDFASFDFSSRQWLRSCSLCRTNNELDLNQNPLNFDVENQSLDVLVVRFVGSVEAQLKELKEYLEFLRLNLRAQCKTVNHPDTMICGMRKDYYMDLQSFGFVVPTDYFESSITYDELSVFYSCDMDKRLIKPVTGELGNSIEKLSDISEDWLRRKQPLVGGWLVQLIRHEIRNGEFQIFFIGKNISHSNKKIYNVVENEIPANKDNNRTIELYEPSENEIEWAKKVRDIIVETFKVKLDVYRVDYFIDNNGNPILLEFEMVNPGLFITYMDDNRRNVVVDEFWEYCEMLLQQT